MQGYYKKLGKKGEKGYNRGREKRKVNFKKDIK